MHLYFVGCNLFTGETMLNPDNSEIVQAIATETNTPTEVVSKLYADTLAEFAEGASIQDFVPLFAVRRVRAALKAAQTELH